jgi:predicted DCC family thiol-disulfide oxidoreductase YuxK
MMQRGNSATAVQRDQLVVWFDGACPLCLREIGMMRRLERRQAIRFVDVASPETVCPIDRSALLARLHAREDGVLLSGAAAFAAMWRAIPVLRPLGLLARNRLMLRVLEAAYLRFLKVRPRLQALLKQRGR